MNVHTDTEYSFIERKLIMSNSNFNKDDLYNMAFDTEDTTGSVDASDIAENKAVSLLSYIGFLAFIPYFCAKESRFARYHAIRGINLFIIEFILGIISSVLGFIPVVGWIVSAVVGLVSLAYSIIGIVNVVKGRCRELPFISAIKFVKQ